MCSLAYWIGSQAKAVVASRPLAGLRALLANATVATRQFEFVGLIEQEQASMTSLGTEKRSHIKRQ